MRIKNREGFGELGRQVQGRTLPDPPASPPVHLASAAVTADSARLSWDPPLVPNGEIGEYHVQLTPLERGAKKIVFTNQTQLVMENLLSYTW